MSDNPTAYADLNGVSAAVRFFSSWLTWDFGSDTNDIYSSCERLRKFDAHYSMAI